MRSENRFETKVDGVDVVLVKEPRVRTFGGWYQHTAVLVDGQEIGRIQTRRRNRRTDTLTCLKSGGCVMGSDLGWLIGHRNIVL
jgi:hypothetical protein